jgi:hypothetical protein
MKLFQLFQNNCSPERPDCARTENEYLSVLLLVASLTLRVIFFSLFFLFFLFKEPAENMENSPYDDVNRPLTVYVTTHLR